MWGYVLYLAFGPGRQPPIDRLDDPRSWRRPRSAAPGRWRRSTGCRWPALAHAAERANVLARANGGYAAMLDELTTARPWCLPGTSADPPTSGWATGGPTSAIARVRRRPAAPNREPACSVSAKPGEGQQITGWIDEFAKANRMPSCVSPTDA